MPDKKPHNSGPGSLGYDMRRQAAVEAIAVCHRIPKAAEMCGLDAKTLYRYWKDPSFQVEVALCRQQIRETAVSATLDSHLEALLSGVKDLADADPKVRESARNAIFQTTLGMIDRQTLIEQANKIQEELDRRESPPQ